MLSGILSHDLRNFCTKQQSMLVCDAGILYNCPRARISSQSVHHVAMNYIAGVSLTTNDTELYLHNLRPVLHHSNTINSVASAWVAIAMLALVATEPTWAMCLLLISEDRDP